MSQKTKYHTDGGVDALHGTNDMSEGPVPVFIAYSEGLDIPANISTRSTRSLLGQKNGETVKDALARFKL